MEQQLYSIYDEITEIYNTPFSVINEKDAIRSFRLLATDLSTLVGKSPQDYSLYRVATYDTCTGKFVNFHVPELIIRATQLIPPPEAN